MTLPSLFLLALGLSMDAFAVSVSNSLCFAGLRRRDGALTSAAFGIFQGLMPILGFFAGRLFAEAVSAVDHWIAFVLLGFIGGKMLAEALRELRAGETGACAPQKRFSLRLVLVQAVATSIDALAVGVSLAALAVNIWSAAAFIACVTFACCLVGHAVGRRFGALLGSKAQVLGGIILIVLGAKILIEHLSGG